MPSHPTPADIRELRDKHAITQAAAAALLYTSTRAYQQWEAGDRKMHPAFWELLRIKADLRSPLLKISPE